MQSNTDALIEKVKRDPEFHALVQQRTGFAWTLAGLMMAIYFGFILVVAFAPGLLGQPIGSGVTTIGIPIGVGVILAAFVLTGIYVARANSRFDAMTAAIVARTR